MTPKPRGPGPPTGGVEGAGSSFPTLERAQRGVARAGKVVEGAVFVLASALLVYISAVLFAQVIYRYVLVLPLPWSEESARFALVWLGMLAAAITARSGLHFAFRWGTFVLPEVWRSHLRLVVNVLLILFLLLLLDLSLSFLDLVSNQTAQATGVNMRVPYAGITAGTLVLLALYLFEVLDGVIGLFTGVRLSEAELNEQAMLLALGSKEGAEQMGERVAKTFAPPRE